MIVVSPIVGIVFAWIAALLWPGIWFTDAYDQLLFAIGPVIAASFFGAMHGFIIGRLFAAIGGRVGEFMGSELKWFLGSAIGGVVGLLIYVFVYLIFFFISLFL
jgi:hypothetical protein